MKTKYNIKIEACIGCFYGVVTLSDSRGTAATWKFDYWTNTCTRSVKRRGLGSKIAAATLTSSKFLQVEYFIALLGENKKSITL